MMKKGTAAAYCDLTPTEFEREVIAGKLPLPVPLGNHEHWSRAALDDYLAELAGEARHDWRKDQPLYAA
ncbi:MAG: hypothetical protein ABW043_16805 [Devosia sp.]|uniref:hypothetical protein n=1 Tax=Devosia sp. TaxID=1871048 RepID=UPI00339A52EE